MKKLTGKEVSAAIEARLASKVEQLKSRGHQPALAVILVGDNPESHAYVNRKLVTAERMGIRSVDHKLPASTSQAELEALVNELNADPGVNGVLCQLPLPPHLDPERITQLIDPAKDVDCFHPHNFGLLAQGTPRFIPCTPAGVIAMLEHYEIPVRGKHVVVLGRSNIVGRPLALLLLQKGRDATVTVCHSRTVEPERITRQADILVAAIGKPEWVRADMVREGAVVIDVGVNRVEDASRPKGYRVTGDVDFQAVSPLASAISPVPGGAGPMTIVMLMRNTLQAAALQHGLDMGEGMAL